MEDVEMSERHPRQTPCRRILTAQNFATTRSGDAMQPFFRARDRSEWVDSIESGSSLKRTAAQRAP
jgi:hypothetical protein